MRGHAPGGRQAKGVSGQWRQLVCEMYQRRFKTLSSSSFLLGKAFAVAVHPPCHCSFGSQQLQAGIVRISKGMHVVCGMVRQR